ncbi:hypothetical protein [Nonomuraea basaltis]|uniref:hypothetical protein n=1 Tax=Nonomuraea basaltis TaxID=2495887 RepID=UPI00110C5EB5|nr:hypothetical protein [Nonomuraea basaltis]TMR87941.1 hypothetical protein EJK15_68985 [Nonomuraea basaltis]
MKRILPALACVLALGVSAVPAHAQDPTPEPTASQGDVQSQTPQPPGDSLAAAPDACTIYGCYTGDGWGSGFGRWVADGDKMWVCDRSADGWSIVVFADIGGSAQPEKWHTSGAGQCTERSYGNVAEGKYIDYFTCLGKYSTNEIKWDSCGLTRSGTT